MFIYTDNKEEALDIFFEELDDDEDKLLEVLISFRDTGVYHIEYGHPTKDDGDEVLGEFDINFDEFLEYVDTKDIIFILLDKITGE